MPLRPRRPHGYGGHCGHGGHGGPCGYGSHCGHGGHLATAATATTAATWLRRAQPTRRLRRPRRGAHSGHVRPRRPRRPRSLPSPLHSPLPLPSLLSIAAIIRVVEWLFRLDMLCLSMPVMDLAVSGARLAWVYSSTLQLQYLCLFACFMPACIYVTCAMSAHMV